MEETIFVISDKQIESVNDRFLSLFQPFIIKCCPEVTFNVQRVPKIKQIKKFLVETFKKLKKCLTCAKEDSTAYLES